MPLRCERLEPPMSQMGLGRVKTLGGRSALTEVGDARRIRGFGHARIAAIRG